MAGHDPIDDNDDAEDEVEIIDQPTPTPSPLKSQKKIVKGGKKWVIKNITQTGNADGDILTWIKWHSTGQTGKSKGTYKDKGKGKALTKPKANPKAKGKGMEKATVKEEDISSSEDIDATVGKADNVKGDGQNKACKWFIQCICYSTYVLPTIH